MLAMKDKCEKCSVELPPHSGEAWICSYECTFCGTCRAELGVCPNCQGELVRRPRRKSR